MFFFVCFIFICLSIKRTIEKMKGTICLACADFVIITFQLRKQCVF